MWFYVQVYLLMTTNVNLSGCGRKEGKRSEYGIIIRGLYAYLAWCCALASFVEVFPSCFVAIVWFLLLLTFGFAGWICRFTFDLICGFLLLWRRWHGTNQRHTGCQQGVCATDVRSSLVGRRRSEQSVRMGRTAGGLVHRYGRCPPNIWRYLLFGWAFVLGLSTSWYMSAAGFLECLAMAWCFCGF